MKVKFKLYRLNFFYICGRNGRTIYIRNLYISSYLFRWSFFFFFLHSSLDINWKSHRFEVEKNKKLWYRMQMRAWFWTSRRKTRLSSNYITLHKIKLSWKLAREKEREKEIYKNKPLLFLFPSKIEDFNGRKNASN